VRHELLDANPMDKIDHHRAQDPAPPAGPTEGQKVLGKSGLVRTTPTSPSFNSGVFIEAVRRRLGHASTETTQVYILLADKIADDEIRAARRRRDTRR
jgi:hypothetical protein